jgi:MFS family permease
MDHQSEWRSRAAPMGKPSSTWFALRNPLFCRLWLAALLSGTFVSSQDVTATWLMHYFDASPFLLSLMATAASAPFFLFTLPAGAVADIVNRRTVIVCSVLWQAAWSVILAIGAWTEVLNPGAVLACIFALGIGLAFGVPVWGAIVPDIVNKEELPSAITLGGVQLNLSGIVGPAIGGFLLPLLGAPLLISLNAMAFLAVALVVMQWKPRQTSSPRLCENFTESLISSLRYARNSQRLTTFAGVAWALAGSELWVAGQRVMPGWVRGRMNAFLIMLGQGSMALGAVLWATGVANIGLDFTFAAAAVMALFALAIGHRLSINFATEAQVEEAPLAQAHDLSVVPDEDDGPITITIDYLIASEDRDRFRILIPEIQAIFRRNGAFQCRLDESLDHPGLFRLEYLVSTWAEHLRQRRRMTIEEAKVYREAWNLHAGDVEPIVRHYRSTDKFIQLPGFGFSGRSFMNTSRMPMPRPIAVVSEA